MTLADMIVVLRAGRIEQVGSPATLCDDPDNVFVAGFIGSPKMNFLDARIGETGEDVAGTHWLPAPALDAAAAPGTQVKLGVRPEHLGEARNGEQAVPFEVGFTEFLGGVSYLHGEIGDGLSGTVEARRHRSATGQCHRDHRRARGSSSLRSRRPAPAVGSALADTPGSGTSVGQGRCPRISPAGPEAIGPLFVSNLKPTLPPGKDDVLLS